MVQTVKPIERRAAGRRTETPVTLEGRRLTLTNLEKKLYPDGFTKAQVIDYYAKIAPALLPHLKGRPFTLKRYPEGTENGFFYEKQCPSYRPGWVSTVAVAREKTSKKTGVIRYCTVDDLPTLVWIANAASLELHTLLSLKGDVKRPTMIAIDLDPGAPAGILDCCWAALELKKVLDRLGLRTFPKTSGGKGLHFYVPLNTPVDFDRTKSFARSLAAHLEAAFPARVTAKMSKALRAGKVFVDWSQNDEHKTTVCAYSLRARERPTVSTPVTWDEVAACLRSGDPSRLTFTAPQALERVARRGDLFAPVLTLNQKLPRAAA